MTGPEDHEVDDGDYGNAEDAGVELFEVTDDDEDWGV